MDDGGYWESYQIEVRMQIDWIHLIQVILKNIHVIASRSERISDKPVRGDLQQYIDIHNRASSSYG
jgi:hypothetical protein